jgi:hypothetical protein
MLWLSGAVKRFLAASLSPPLYQVANNSRSFVRGGRVRMTGRRNTWAEAHAFMRGKDAGCPTHSWVWNEWEKKCCATLI